MRYRLTALTPLLVGDGRALSPVDYMVWKDQVNVLDQNRIFKLLARGPRLEGYLTQLRKATKLDFASWGGFAQNFSARRIPFENAESTAVWNAAPSESLFIPTFSAGHRGSYIPASTVKGALRTGLVFSRWNAATMDRLAGSIEHDRFPRRASEAAENAAGATQVRVLSLADSDPATSGNYKIFLTRTASLNTTPGGSGGKSQLAWKVAGRGSVPGQRMADATPVFAEMATPGTAFEGSWHELKHLENQELTRALGWLSVPDPKSIVAAANDYARAQLTEHSRFAEAAGLPALQASLERLKATAEAVSSTPLSCLLCVGWGGGFVSKAAFPDTANASLRRILKTVPALSRAGREGALLPKTRRLVFVGGQPATLPGWVRLDLSE